MSEKVNYFDSFIEMSNYIVSSSQKLNEVANNFNVKEQSNPPPIPNKVDIANKIKNEFVIVKIEKRESC